MSATTDITQYADEYLHVGQIEDWPNALNGLQLENSGTVTKIAAAVDVSTHTLERAADARVNLLAVHHGMFWPGLRPVRKGLYRQLKTALDHDIAIYSAHLLIDLRFHTHLSIVQLDCEEAVREAPNGFDGAKINFECENSREAHSIFWNHF